MASDQSDQATVNEIAQASEKLKQDVERAIFQQAMQDEHDRRPAIITVQAGPGGAEAHYWAETLTGMYSRWAQIQNRPTEVLDVTYAGKVGIRSATISVGGQHAYGLLKGEAGTHRLSRVSNFDRQGRRHTSFAQVEIIPELPPTQHAPIREDEVKFQAFRASGPGGQSVQKTATAVRLTHLPTGIVATCQTERSQHQNRNYATRLLQARVLEYLRQIDEREPDAPHEQSSGWGHRARSYILNPKAMVKDHRTGHQENDASRVLDGCLDGFINADLLRRVE